MTLQWAERKIHSQNGEDGIIAHLCQNAPRRFVEIGYAPKENNTLALEEAGWSGIRLDANDGIWVTAENAPWLLTERHIPPGPFGFLSIDIDGQDYWVWKSLLDAGYRPSVVCIEYNASLGYLSSRTVPPDNDWVWDGSEHFGASLMALARLGATYGYQLVYCESAGVNAFFVNVGHEFASDAILAAVATWRPRTVGHRAAPEDAAWRNPHE